ncbi:MAG TPA: DUF169 domain-containing protein [Spirochaetia bacterium]|nr:DUF169 domain-containing protein [Spirochaetia bacterium]
MDTKEAAAQLNRYLLPSSFPLGIGILESREGVPKSAKTPVHNFKKKLAVCQLVTMARRYGWTVAFGREEQKCALGSLIFGFDHPGPFYLEGHLAEQTYVSSSEAGVRSEQTMQRLAYNPERWVVIGPLDRIDFDPDIVLVYGHPAQMMRLIQADLYGTGGAFATAMSGRGACAEEIAAPYLSGKCQMGMPCTGERVFAQTQDHEMAFGIPAGRLDGVLKGLAETHRKGVRYPITSTLNYEAVFPAAYSQVEKEFGREGD